jgi:penicillin-binding protein 1C
MRVTGACDGVLAEWFRPGDEPLDLCPAHVRVAVDTRTGRPATRKTPRPFVELRTFVDLPPRYASWAAAAGLPRPPDPDAPTGLAHLLAGDIVRLSIRSPEDGLRVLRDPETPPDQSTLALRALVNPPVPQVVWYVDGVPFQVPESVVPIPSPSAPPPGSQRGVGRCLWGPSAPSCRTVAGEFRGGGSSSGRW